MRWNRLWLTRWLAENDNPMFYWPTFCLRMKEGLFNPPSAIPAQARLQGCTPAWMQVVEPRREQAVEVVERRREQAAEESSG